MTPVRVSCVLVAAATATALAQAPRGDAERGRQLFVKTGCYQCHGYEAQGASTGPRLGPDAVAFARFVSYVRKPTGDMPPYTARVMSDAELADVYAFVTSRRKPRKVPRFLGS
jgi:ubiquinol-cytochrome c reductase cytochrome c subunit